MKLFNAIAAAAVIGISLIAATPAEAFWGNDKAKRASAKPLNTQLLADDIANRYRFEDNWTNGNYFRMTGKVKGIYDANLRIVGNRVRLQDGSTAEFELACGWDRNKQTREKISQLSVGDYVTVTTKLSDEAKVNGRGSIRPAFGKTFCSRQI